MNNKIFTTLILIILGSAIQAQIDLESDLIAHYPFSGNANNIVGDTLHGTVHNALLMTDRFGVAGEAYGFNGSNKYIEIAGNDSLFNLNPDGYTISLWIYLSQSQLNSIGTILGYGGYNDNGWAVRFHREFSSFEFSLHSSPSTNGCNKFVPVETGKWVYFTMVYKEDLITIYLNGKQYSAQYCPNYHPTSGFNLVLGVSSNYLSSGFVGKMDDVRLYNRALSFLEVATLAENSSAVDAAKKGTVFHADFEKKVVDSEQLLTAQDLANGGNLRVTENPEKDDVNSSEFVMRATTPKSKSWSYSRAEFSPRWDKQFETKEKTHIFQWMVYFPEDYLLNIDTIWYDWQLITQFVTHPCAWAKDGFKNAICGSGGIFNELRINLHDYNEYRFEYRAAPDCNKVPYNYTRGEWIKLTYQILWTTESHGFYKVWANEHLLGEAHNVQTLPAGWREGECDLRWKVGLYDSWYDQETDSVYYYIDNLEAYIDKDFEKVCPTCDKQITGTDRVILDKNTNINLYPNPSTGQIKISGLNEEAILVVYNINGTIVKQLHVRNNFSLSELPKGIYLIEIKTGNEKYFKRIVKI